MGELQALELRKTDWQQAQAQFQHWGANRKFSDDCDSDRCSLEVTLNEFVLNTVMQHNPFIKIDDYLRWRLKLHYDMGPFQRLEFPILQLYMRAGGHPARVTADVRMRDGIVWGESITVWIETYANPGPENHAGEYGLVAEVGSVSRFDYYGEPWITRQLVAHPDYQIGRPGGCHVCVMGWVKFTPYAAPGDVRRLT